LRVSQWRPTVATLEIVGVSLHNKVLEEESTIESVLVPVPFVVPMAIAQPTHVIQLESWPRALLQTETETEFNSFLPIIISQLSCGICSVAF